MARDIVPMKGPYVRNDIRETEPVDGWRTYEIEQSHWYWDGEEITEQEFHAKWRHRKEVQMPLSKPHKDENKSDFIERCMGDDVMKEEFPDNDQRLAVCHARWNGEHSRGSPKSKVVNYRCYDSDVEIRDDEGLKIRGHAAVFNRQSDDLGGFVEVIEPGFFRKAIKRSNTAALWNHNSDIILGRKSAKTLVLEEDDNGLSYTITPPSWAGGYLETIKRGDVTQSSFAFTVSEKGEKWDEEDGVRIRTLLSGGCDELYDVSPVTYPAYPDTDVKVRMADSDLSRIREVISEEVDKLKTPSDLDVQGVPEELPGRVDSLDIKKKRLRLYESNRR